MLRATIPLALAAVLAAAPFHALAAGGDGPAPLSTWLLPFTRGDPAEDALGAGAIACPLGDLDGDKVDDLLVHVAGAAAGAPASLEAVSGAAPTQTLWTLPTGDGEVLQCAPDVAGDGVADPLLRVKDAADGLPAQTPVSAESAKATLQALDGTTGQALLTLTGEETENGGDTDIADGGVARALDLEPAALDLLLFVTSEVTQAQTQLPLGGLALTSQREEVRIELLASDGTVRGVIEPGSGAEILAYGLAAAPAGAPGDLDALRVLVLSATEGSPLEEIDARVPTITAYTTEGSVEWSVELDATANDLLLVPNAGDLDADGVPDLLLAQIPSDPALADEVGSVLALSGADGSEILALAGIDGLVAALPMGDVTPTVPGDPHALLLVAKGAAGDALLLECVQADETLWEAELPAEAAPLNALIDPFTGDALGFTDLTGDGIPDVAALVPGDDPLSQAVQVIDGADGSSPWTTVVGHVNDAATLAGPTGADLALVSTDPQAGTLRVSLLDGATGEVAWTAQAALPEGVQEPQTEILPFTGADGASSMLLTVVDKAKDDAGAAPPVPTGAAYVIDAATGTVETTKGTTPGTPPPLETLAEEGGKRSPIPAPGALGVTLALVAAAALVALRRRRS